MRFPVRFTLLLMLAAPSAAWAGPGDSHRPPAAPNPATLCETAVAGAEYVARLPPRLLGAISLTESGRVEPTSGHVRAWPWTINADGEGQFFQTRQQAVAAVRLLQARGVRSIDVGCLQVNLMYHPNAFATLEDAFDPHINAAYAARFLNALYADGRDWARAIAAYHSETPALGAAYRLLVMARWQNADLRAPLAAQRPYADFVRPTRPTAPSLPAPECTGPSLHRHPAARAFSG